MKYVEFNEQNNNFIKQKKKIHKQGKELTHKWGGVIVKYKQECAINEPAFTYESSKASLFKYQYSGNLSKYMHFEHSTYNIKENFSVLKEIKFCSENISRSCCFLNSKILEKASETALHHPPSPSYWFSFQYTADIKLTCNFENS